MFGKIIEWYKSKKEFHNEAVEFVKSIIFALIIALVLRSSVVEANYIFSGSMTPTLLAGDYILVYKTAYNIRIPFSDISIFHIGNPERGDIVTFVYPHDKSKIFVKRVVGLPGDVVEIRNQKLLINNEQIHYERMPNFDSIYLSFNEHLGEHIHTIIERNERSLYGEYGPIVVPEGNYFVLGDNRDNSADSRFWGFVPYKNVLGKALVTYFSNSETLSSFPPAIINWIRGIRWKRIGVLLVNA
ncbi:MAG: signal peptidase I [Candidatus Firestonebacteria bacterium]|nr:signal peptidase I [Candidatus Firestonebacteria bacterium]